MQDGGLGKLLKLFLWTAYQDFCSFKKDRMSFIQHYFHPYTGLE